MKDLFKNPIEGYIFPQAVVIIVKSELIAIPIVTLPE